MTFVFNDSNFLELKKIISNYPQGKQASAVIAALDLAQRQNNGWISEDVIETVANLLEMPPIRVREVATFYSMFNLKPVGRYHVQICGTPPCYLCNSEKITSLCSELLGIKIGETTPDKLFTLTEVECLGACIKAPVIQINDEYYENVDEELLKNILDTLRQQASRDE